MPFLKLFVSVLICLSVIDLTWLGLIAGNLYRQDIGHLMGQINIMAAIPVYIALTLGIIFFVLPKGSTLAETFMWGAIFGAIIYGVYDFTNYATLANWPLRITLVDMVWGTFLCGVASTFGAYIKGVL